jgi:hypothetical protein|tara:strand:+ start:984 stop:1184 length:201 start_codon:yes stop_codon:yes gene_type:complete
MKIYLTEVEDNGKIYAGPNILALNWEEAEKAAKYNNLILVGEFVEIVTEGGLMHYIDKADSAEVLH